MQTIMGTKCDLSDFEHCMVVGALQAGLSNSESADLLGFSHSAITQGFKENGVRKVKYP